MSDRFIDGEPEGAANSAIDMGFGEGEVHGEEPAAGEDEADEFGSLFRKLRGVALPILKRVAPLAARAVLGPAFPLREGEDYETELDEDGFYGDGFFIDGEGVALDEDETEDPASGLSAEDEAIAESLAAAAMRAATDEEALGMAGGLTIHILGPAPVHIRRMTPLMVGQAARLVRLLRRSPRTRPLVPVVGSITRATTRDLMRHIGAGRRLSPHLVAATMARQTAQTLGNPRKVARALVRNRRRRRAFDWRALARAER